MCEEGFLLCGHELHLDPNPPLRLRKPWDTILEDGNKGKDTELAGSTFLPLQDNSLAFPGQRITRSSITLEHMDEGAGDQEPKLANGTSHIKPVLVFAPE